MASGFSKRLPGAAARDPRRELLARLIKKETGAVNSTAQIPPRHSGEALPLSFAQERLWFLDQWEPGNPAYNVVRAFRLLGPLDGPILAQSVDLIAQRHEALRTTFPTLGDQPVQSIARTLDPILQTVDLRGLRRRSRETETARVIRAEARHRFDLATGPLLRLLLCQLGREDHVLVLVAHQIIFDGRSLDIFYRELEALYANRDDAKGANLPPLTVQYSDYALWQREELTGDALTTPLTYWKSQLDGALPALELPADRPRPARQSLAGSRSEVVIDRALTDRLKALSRRSAVTLFVTLMAAFKVLLLRYTAQDDIIVGFPVASRDRQELENLIGFFVNTLPLRTDLSGDPSFRALLARVRAGTEGALAHRDLPFERLVEELAQERDLSRNLLFQTMFTFQNRLPAEIHLAGIHAEPIRCDAGTSKFDLTLSLGERDGGLSGFFEFRSDLFDRPTIDRMIGHFQSLLKGIAADPDRSISALPLLTPAERNQILLDWNNTAAKFPEDRCVHQLIEAQAKKTPNAVAVEWAGQSLTYGELNRRANRLARYLRQRGLGPEKLAPVCVQRSLEMIVGLLGILKAGGAYVPLDPRYPCERLRFMLSDSQACILLTQARFIEDEKLRTEAGDSRFSVFNPQIETVCLDVAWKTISRQSDKNLRNRATANNLAYVIYTSGSTGLPKGVAVEHRNVVAFLHWARSVFSRSELAGVLASTSICFDLSVFEMFAPLCWGGKVILTDDALALQERRQRAVADRVTLINTVPSVMNELLAAGALPPTVRTVNLAGEPLKQETVRRLYETGTVGKVYDLYGPSETTTYSTFSLRGREGRATIGRPIANTKIYLLDGALEPVPVGVPGELYIGGAGVARGYLNRPELTRERFIPDPFGVNDDKRLYRTGDLARYLPDGNIEYLGRVDNQVKIRGHRIEIGEIEAVLNRHPAIGDCVVAARETPIDGSGHLSIRDSKFQNTDLHKELIAFFVPNGAAAPTEEDLRRFLRQTLPEFMLPSSFVALDSLPLNANGKVDRGALPVPSGCPPRAAREFVLPRGEIEELVAQIWRQVLGLEEIGVHDNFFDIGGHSLIAARAATRVRSRLNVELPLRKLFELPTVAELANYLEQLRRVRCGVRDAPIMRVKRDRDLPLSSAQQRLWFLQKLDGDSSAYHIPAAYRIYGPLKPGALEAALNQMIERHESLRTAIVESQGRPTQRILPHAHLTLRRVDLTSFQAERANDEVRRLANLDLRLPYDLAIAPLMRASLLGLGAEEHVLLLNFHHIIADASSLAYFHRELAAFYEAALVGSAVSLPRLPVQFADYASWQQRWLGSAAAKAQLAYWRRQLNNPPPPLDLAADYERPVRSSYRGARTSKRLSLELTRALKDLSRREGATLFMTLLAGLSILLGRLAGRDDFVIGSTIAGRNRPELEGAIGFFINALALRCDLSGGPNFTDLLKRAREACLDAYSHQDLPFDKVVEALNPGRDLARNPLFEVMFNMNEVSERALKLKDCRTEKLIQSEPSAKFDITLYAPEVEGAIELAMVYNADLFGPARMAIYLDQLSAVLEQAVTAPGKSIEQFSLLTQSTEALLPDPVTPLGDRWFGTAHEMISRQAQTGPERLALTDATGNWRYRELDLQSNQLAHYFLDHGLGPRDVIAIHAQRSASLVVALLGALKAGAIFVVLDPAYPAARLIDYLSIAEPKAWLQLEPGAKLPQTLAKFLGTASLRCRLNVPPTKNEIASLLVGYSAKAPEIALGADDPAYIAFTSGSTGHPKGVLCRHGPVSHFLPWQEEVFALRNRDRYSLLSGLGYNHLQREIFTALASGARLYVPSAAQVQSPALLTSWLRDRKISILHLTPALGRMIQTAGAAPLPSLRRIFFGGDVLTRHDVAAIGRLAPKAKIVSFYGATETQRAVGFFRVDEDEPKTGAGEYSAVPTGRGAPDVQLLLLTRGGRLAGVGELGDLYVRSPHLAAGYVRDEEPTKLNFLTNPFTGDPRDRLYRSGEFGRYRPDGNVEWVGRRDRRVSIRGFRVELAEIESALMQHPELSSAAVVEISKLKSGPADQNSRFSEQLIAYVVTDDSARILATELRAFLAARLPHYMVPADFIFLDRLPLSPNGKVDYSILPAPSHQRDGKTSWEAPRSAIEKHLAEMVSEILGVKKVGRQDDFFRLGGHSLLAAQAAARIRERLGVGLDLRTFLEAPTVEALARRVEAMGGSPRIETGREEIEL